MLPRFPPISILPEVDSSFKKESPEPSPPSVHTIEPAVLIDGAESVSGDKLAPPVNSMLSVVVKSAAVESITFPPKIAFPPVSSRV